MVKQFSCLLILAGIVLASCRLKEIQEPYPAINKIKNHTKYKINLPEEHSSGYIWQLSENYDMTKITLINSAWHGNEKGVDFNFETLAAGTTTLTFVLRKYTDTSEIKHFAVDIIDE